MYFPAVSKVAMHLCTHKIICMCDLFVLMFVLITIRLQPPSLQQLSGFLWCSMAKKIWHRRIVAACVVFYRAESAHWDLLIVDTLAAYIYTRGESFWYKYLAELDQCLVRYTKGL